MNFILTVPEKRKVRTISTDKAERMNDILVAIQEMKAIEAGKRKPRSMKSLLREL